MKRGPTHNDTHVFVVGEDEDGTRLDQFCASRIRSLSRSRAQKLNKCGRVLVGGAIRPDHHLVKTGETVAIRIPTEREGETPPTPQTIPIKISYEDDDIIVVNKDAGMVVHPAHGNWKGTLVNALLGRGTMLSALGGTHRPGIVHRLDKDTSGLIVAAKRDDAFRRLSELMNAREVEKTYHAIVWGNIGARDRTIDQPIARHPVHRQRMAVARRGGREAVTNVFVVDSFEYFDYIRVTTSTGRTHQIRVHLAHISHPLLGDPVYGGRRTKGFAPSARVRSRMAALLKIIRRHALHASELCFAHPVTGRQLRLRSALPDDMRLALEMLHREDRTKEAKG